MKNALVGIVLGLLAGAVGAWLFLRHHDVDGSETKTEENKEESHVRRGTIGETILKLDKEAQQRAGLKTAVLEAAELRPELKAFGRVLDPAPLAAALTEIAAAKTQLEASAKEAERLKILFGQNQNASARAVEAAEAAVRRDQIAHHAAEIRFVSAWGKEMVQRPDLDSLIHSAIAQENVLVRIDIPASERLEGAPRGARLALLSAPDIPMDAEFLATAMSADPQTLSRGFIFLLKGKALPANAPVIAWLSLPGETEKGVVVPREAIVRHEGEAFVYVQTSDETFERKECELVHPLEKGWFTSKLKPGMKIVVTGAQQLLSEELKGEGGE